MLLVGVAAAVAAGVGVMLWSVGPTYSLLYANLGGEDAAQVTQALDSARIPYKLEDGGGSISVPAEQLASARLKLAAQGLPEGGGGVNAMTKDPGFGVSAFMENARYQHALETELARTIASLQNVQGARVHLAMARQSAFVSDRRPGSASVFLQIKAGRRLDDEQVQAIANLVASSIPEMQASQVTVIDQAGRLLSAPNTDSDHGRARQDVRVRASPRRVLCATHPGDADAAGGPGPRARPGRGAGRHGHHGIDARAVQSAEPGGAQRITSPRKPRAMARAMPAAYPARSPISRRSRASRCRPVRTPAVAQSGANPPAGAAGSRRHA